VLDIKRPFYKSVKHLTLSPISKDDWINCIIQAFKKSKKAINETIIDKIFEITKGFPYYTQQLCYEIWELTEKEVSEDILNLAL